MNGRRWITVSETSAKIGVSRLTVYRLARLHKIPALKLPGLGVRIDSEQLTAMLEQAVSQPSKGRGR